MSMSIPLLLEDESSLDWEQARYSTKLTISDHDATVEHTLRHAPQLQRLLDEGAIRRVLELRCPTTLLSRWVSSDTSTCRAEWKPNEVHGEMFFIPGLIAAKQLTLSGEGLSDLWTAPITVPRGHWLARGDVSRAKSLSASLLSFHSRPDLVDGCMRIEPSATSGDLHFNVWVSESLLPQCRTRRDLQIAALIGVFGRIPLIDEEHNGELDDDASPSSILQNIKQKLREANVPLWGGELDRDFDPAWAATAIEPFALEVMDKDS